MEGTLKLTVYYKEHQNDTVYQSMELDLLKPAVITKTLMAETTLQFTAKSYAHPELLFTKLKPFLVYVDTHSGKFYLTEQPTISKISETEFACEVLMKAEDYKLSFYKFKDLSNRLAFSLTMYPHEMIELLVAQLNERDSDWQVGEVITDVIKTVSFDSNFIQDALKMIADTFDTEYEVVNKTIHLRKVEYYKESPFEIAYGENKGLLSAIVTKSNKVNQIEVLHVQGGERNIDPTKNSGYSKLRLPVGYRIDYNGETFGYPGLSPFDPPAAGYRRYYNDGNYIKRDDIEQLSKFEDVYINEEVYPHRVGTVTGVETVNASENRYDFFDTTIPSTLDYSQNRIVGETITVKFETGDLAGKEFKIEQTEDVVIGYVHSERRFKVLAQEEDGAVMPSDTFRIQVGDKYAVFGMEMPAAYKGNNLTHSGASWDLYREAVKYMYDREDTDIGVEIKIDPVFLRQVQLLIDDRMRLGSYFLIQDSDIVGEDLLVRIVSIAQNLFYEEVVEVTLSNTYLRRSYRTQIERNKAKAENERETNKDAFTKQDYKTFKLDADVKTITVTLQEVTFKIVEIDAKVAEAYKVAVEAQEAIPIQVSAHNESSESHPFILNLLESLSNGALFKDGSVQLQEGYTPTEPQSIVTKQYADDLSVIRYDKTQELQDVEKQQARSNIGALVNSTQPLIEVTANEDLNYIIASVGNDFKKITPEQLKILLNGGGGEAELLFYAALEITKDADYSSSGDTSLLVPGNGSISNNKLYLPSYYATSAIVWNYALPQQLPISLSCYVTPGAYGGGNNSMFGFNRQPVERYSGLFFLKPSGQNYQSCTADWLANAMHFSQIYAPQGVETFVTFVFDWDVINSITKVKLYINGIFAEELSSVNNWLMLNGNEHPSIGLSNSSNTQQGYYRRFSIFEGEMTSEQILTLYNNGGVPNY